MSNNTIINASTKRLVWLLTRPNHADHGAAVVEATRRVERGAKATDKLLPALDRLSTTTIVAPTVKAATRVVQSPSAPKGSSKDPITPKGTVTKKAAPKKAAAPKVRTLTSFQKAVLADPDTYGEGFGPKRRDRGLAPLTSEQREARKALYAEQNG